MRRLAIGLVAGIMLSMAVAQTLLTDLGTVSDKRGSSIDFSSGPTIVFLSASDSDSGVSSGVGLSREQVRSLQNDINKAMSCRIGKGQSIGYPSYRRGNSDASVLITSGEVCLCVTEGKLMRFLSIDRSNYSKLMAVLKRASGGGKTIALPPEPAQPVQPRQPGQSGPAYPTHP